MTNKLFLTAEEIDLTISIHRSVLYIFLRDLEKPHAWMRASLAFAKLAQHDSQRDDDPVDIEHRRLLNEYSSSKRGRDLSFSKQGAARLQPLSALFFSPERLAEEIAIALERLAQKSPRRGRAFVSEPVFETGNRGAKISITRESWAALNRFFNSASLEEKGQALTQQIRLLFLSTYTLKRIIEPARGRRANKQVLGDYLPQAYFACRELLRESKTMAALEKAIEIACASFAMQDLAAHLYWTRADGVLARLPLTGTRSFWTVQPEKTEIRRTNYWRHTVARMMPGPGEY